MKAELSLRTEAGDGRREAGNKPREASVFRAITPNPGDMVVKAGEQARSSFRKPIHRFEDLEVWKEAMQLAARIYEAMESSRDFGLRDQMLRAAVSIPSNIAEGYERGSNREFIQFLNYSRGSSGELRTQVYLAAKLRKIDAITSGELLERSRKIPAMLHKYLQVRKRDF